MSPTNICPRCGRTSPAGTAFCASCGTDLSSRTGGKGWKLLLGAVALFAGLLWVTVLYTQPGPTPQLAAATQPQTLSGNGAGTTTQQPAQPAPPSLTLTSAQHLSEARRALADGYKPDRDPLKSKWGEVAAAKWHLRAIDPAAPEYREARELLKEVERRERQIELARKPAERDEDSGEAADADERGDSSSGASSRAASSSSASAASKGSARQGTPADASGGESSDDYYTNSRGVRVHRPMRSEGGPPEGATAQCADGTYSFSQSRRGTCSHHGGVSRWL